MIPNMKPKREHRKEELLNISSLIISMTSKQYI